MLGLLICVPGMIAAQTAEIPQHVEPYSWSSGVYDGDVGPSAKTLLAESHTVAIADAAWLRLQFDHAYLGRNSYITVTSLDDGASQDLNTSTLWQWQYTSAYLNGDAVEVRLYVGPHDEDVFIEIKEVIVGEVPGGPTPLTQCGPTDDRVPSNDPAAGRLLNVGCTGWIVGRGLHVTAGHCSGGSANVLQFNVPLSDPTGSINHPGPEDQYAVDPNSKQSVNGGIGNDWGVFHVYDNSQTGLQPVEAQEDSFTVKQDLGPPTIRITGYGVDFNDPTLNQTQQTHSGPNAGSSGTTMRYQVDTEGGNSGSPVIDDATGEAVGVHTHGGCTTAGTGHNSGTSTFNTAFWDALNPAITITAQPVNPPIVIPAGGGTFDFDVSIINNTNISQSLQAWTNVLTTFGEIIGPTLGPVSVTLSPGQTFSTTLTQEVPGGAPAGQYTYIVNGGSFPNSITATDNFLFSKSSAPTSAPIFVTNATNGTGGWTVLDTKTDEPVNSGGWGELSALQGEEVIPQAFALQQNYPNPFNPSTTILYQLPVAENVRITIYDLSGRIVRELVNERKEASAYSVLWDGKNRMGQTVASGVYIYQIQAGEFHRSRKMLFMK
ncbi:MAG: T9SS type A sorting domain-containing protein [Phycisphaerae bacterium]|nr:T9SS type A sorting domain-containing protein [Phycisphaerae bacterium]